jgi:hypothetical protein
VWLRTRSSGGFLWTQWTSETYCSLKCMIFLEYMILIPYSHSPSACITWKLFERCRWNLVLGVYTEICRVDLIFGSCRLSNIMKHEKDNLQCDIVNVTSFATPAMCQYESQPKERYSGNVFHCIFCYVLYYLSLQCLFPANSLKVTNLPTDKKSHVNSRHLQAMDIRDK